MKLVVCFALSLALLNAGDASPLKNNALTPPSPPKNNTPTPSALANKTAANATCFMNQFRGLSPAEAKSQGISLEKTLAHKLSVGSVAFSVTLMVFGGLMLAAGWKLFTLVLFLSGFGGGFMFSFFAVS